MTLLLEALLEARSQSFKASSQSPCDMTTRAACAMTPLALVRARRRSLARSLGIQHHQRGVPASGDSRGLAPSACGRRQRRHRPSLPGRPGPSKFCVFVCLCVCEAGPGGVSFPLSPPPHSTSCALLHRIASSSIVLDRIASLAPPYSISRAASCCPPRSKSRATVSQRALTAAVAQGGAGAHRTHACLPPSLCVPASVPLHALRPSLAASIPPARPSARTRSHGTVLIRAGRGRSGDCGLRRQGDRRLQHAHPLNPCAPAPPKVLPVGDKSI